MTPHLTLSRDADGGPVTLELDGLPMVATDPVQLAVQLLAVLDVDDVADVAWLWAGSQARRPGRRPANPATWPPVQP